MKGYVSQHVVDCITAELARLEKRLEELRAEARSNNKDLRFVAEYGDCSNQVARLRKAIRPLTMQYF
ncbi:hypothetical protein RBG11_004202 [Vibrio parahaemolyticus]|nr:hypothetical protein [Vibrio parahaemolyticus]